MENAKCFKKIKASFKFGKPRLFFELKKKCGKSIVAVLKITTEEDWTKY